MGVPFFSHDGEWAGFWADGTIKKVPLSGGEPVTLCEVRGVLGASWGSDGNIVFGGPNIGLTQVSAEGGRPEALFDPKTEEGELDVHDPQFLPGALAVLYTLHRTDGGARAEAYSVATGERKILVEDAFTPRYASTGHLVYGTAGGTLFAAPFDLDRLEITGPAVRVVENVATQIINARILFHTASDGTLTYLPAISLDDRALVWVDANGEEERFDVEPRAFRDPRLSPDGTRLAVAIREGDTQDIWVYELQNDTRHRVTLEGINQSPVWTPDGERIAFTSDRDGTPDLFWKPADGSGVAERLYESDLRKFAEAWTLDGSVLVFSEAHPTDPTQLRVLHVGERLVEPFAEGKDRLRFARFSPDGRWIAYTDSGEVVVRPYPGPGGVRQISTEGGDRPIWSWDGREIFYRRGNEVIAYFLETRKSISLFEGPYVRASFNASYDVAPDGRFVMIQPSEDELADRPIHIVDNWFSELRRRVPTP